MANNYIPIATVTVGSGGASSIIFSSIPQTYTDLVLKVSARDSTTANPISSVRVRPNGLTTNLSSKRLYGVNPSPGSDSPAFWLMLSDSSTATSNTFGNSEMYIPNYTSANFKSVSIDAVMENNSSTDYELDLIAGLWSSTTAITSLELFPPSGTFSQYSTATLYGIRNS